MEKMFFWSDVINLTFMAIILSWPFIYSSSFLSVYPLGSLFRPWWPWPQLIGRTLSPSSCCSSSLYSPAQSSQTAPLCPLLQWLKVTPSNKTTTELSLSWYIHNLRHSACFCGWCLVENRCKFQYEFSSQPLFRSTCIHAAFLHFSRSLAHSC